MQTGFPLTIFQAVPAMNINNPPVARIGLLIRKPVADVFEAFVDPDTTPKFWFDRSSGRLETGATVQWYWDRFELTIDVDVRDLDANRRILIEWRSNPDDVSTVEWTFDARTPDSTWVAIENSGFGGDGDAQVAAALDSVGGFALVLAAAKTYLEHGVQLNIVADSH